MSDAMPCGHGWDKMDEGCFACVDEELTTARHSATVATQRMNVVCDQMQALIEENEKLKAMNWVLKDSQLRTYDGMVQELGALREVADAAREMEAKWGKTIEGWNPVSPSRRGLLESLARLDALRGGKTADK